MRAAPLLLLAGYVFTRAALGAAVNPPFNGPDESGHVEYVHALAQGAGGRVTGVEARQPPLYYLLAAVPWRATEGAALPARLFAVRLLSAAAGVGTLSLVWGAASLVWPHRPLLAALAAAFALLAPGHLFLLSSVSNDPPAEALTSLAVLAALRLSLTPSATPPSGAPVVPLAMPPVMATNSSPAIPVALHQTVPTVPADTMSAAHLFWWWVWGLASGAALMTKPTTAPVVIATAAVLTSQRLYQRWHALLARRGVRLLAPALLLLLLLLAAGGAVTGYVTLLSRHPTSSLAAAIARFGPVALLRAPLVYLRLDGTGIGESFRTFWYAYDYAVVWPKPLEYVLAGPALALCLFAALGLVVAGLPRRWGATLRSAPSASRRLPLVLWIAAFAQIAFVMGRFSFGEVLRIEMGGAAQAKAFFPAVLPLSMLLVAGLTGGWARLGLRDDRPLTLAVLCWLLAMDAASLAITLWHHYRWWQVGL